MDLTGPNLGTNMIKLLADGMIRGVKLDWNILMSILIKNWLFFMGVYFIILFVATLKFMIGRWGTLGSLLYNSIYFGVLFMLGLIFGPQIFIDDVFKAACTVVLYPVCYIIVGYILNKIKLR